MQRADSTLVRSPAARNLDALSLVSVYQAVETLGPYNLAQICSSLSHPHAKPFCFRPHAPAHLLLLDLVKEFKASGKGSILLCICSSCLSKFSTILNSCGIQSDEARVPNVDHTVSRLAFRAQGMPRIINSATTRLLLVQIDQKGSTT